ncbi:MAG: ribosome maturation factor RimP [Clostridiaceae bacterium]
MSKTDIENKINELIKPTVNDNGYELYHVEYVREQNEYYLRIYIDSEDGISLNDCEKVSRAVSGILDAEDPIKDSYYLEVSSPGIDRQLFTQEHMLNNIGAQVSVKLSKALDRQKTFKGELLETEEDTVVILVDNENIRIPKEIIKTINIIGEI